MHVPTAALIGLVLAVVPIAAIAAIVWIARLASRPIRPVPGRIHLVQQHDPAERPPTSRRRRGSGRVS